MPERRNACNTSFHETPEKSGSLGVLFDFVSVATDSGYSAGDVSAHEPMFRVNPELPRVRLGPGLPSARLGPSDDRTTFNVSLMRFNRGSNPPSYSLADNGGMARVS